ncbi:hypothetical protein TCON_1957 [Astathelohania contejeani]|uniref:Uncharacterized protein n=1 Tax=Astathelohania contejeani TaxID=164912 RepID=A0ABQ7HXC0_9MICR|nr:hypothetical protein TCON_1957 [Thelohania contejeani]
MKIMGIYINQILIIFVLIVSVYTKETMDHQSKMLERYGQDDIFKPLDDDYFQPSCKKRKESCEIGSCEYEASDCDGKLIGILKCLFKKAWQKEQIIITRKVEEEYNKVKDIVEKSEKCLTEKINKEFQLLLLEVDRIFNKKDDREKVTKILEDFRDLFINENSSDLKKLNDSLEKEIKKIIEKEESTDILSKKIIEVVETHNKDVSKAIKENSEKITKLTIESILLNISGHEKDEIIHAIKETQSKCGNEIKEILTVQLQIIKFSIVDFLHDILCLLKKLWCELESKIICAIKKYCWKDKNHKNGDISDFYCVLGECYDN